MEHKAGVSIHAVGALDQPKRQRLSPDDRRRQLLGIGLRMLVDQPIQDLSIDAVAAEAGISRGLLFHYFPTKTDYYRAVIEAALRRVIRNVAPDDDASPEDALRQSVERFFAQIERRREFYLALVFGNGAVTLAAEDVDTFRMAIARRVASAVGVEDARLPIVHGWIAYVEDQALQWVAIRKRDRQDLTTAVDHCCRAFHALIALG